MTPSTRRGLVSVTVIGPSGASASCPTPAGRGGKMVCSAITPRRFGTTTAGLGHGRLGFRDVAATVDGRVVRVGRPVNGHRLGVGVYVPDDLTAGEKVIVSLLGDVDLGGRTVIVRTADLNGEGRATFEEPPVVGG